MTAEVQRPIVAGGNPAYPDLASKKAVYSKPKLVVYGPVGALTKGATGSIADLGAMQHMSGGGGG